MIGYENRAPVPGQFSGEWLDSGELTAAQSLTLLYEVVLAECACSRNIRTESAIEKYSAQLREQGRTVGAR